MYEMLMSLPSKHMELGKRLRDKLHTFGVSAFLFDRTIHNAGWDANWLAFLERKPVDLIFFRDEAAGREQAYEFTSWATSIRNHRIKTPTDWEPILFDIPLTTTPFEGVVRDPASNEYWKRRVLKQAKNGLSDEVVRDLASEIQAKFWEYPQRQLTKPHVCITVAMTNKEHAAICKPNSSKWSLSLSRSKKTQIIEALNAFSSHYKTCRSEWIFPEKNATTSAFNTLNFGLARKNAYAYDLTDSAYKCKDDRAFRELLATWARSAAHDFTIYVVVDMASLFHENSLYVYRALKRLTELYTVRFLFCVMASLDKDVAHKAMFEELRNADLLEIVPRAFAVRPEGILVPDSCVREQQEGLFFFNIWSPGGLKYCASSTLSQNVFRGAGAKASPRA